MPRSRSRPQPGPRLPARLDPFDGDTLEPDGGYEAVAFTDVTFAAQVAPGVRLLGCSLSACVLSDCELPQATLRDVAAEQLRAVGTDLSEGIWTSVEVSDSLLAGAQLYELTANQVTFRDCKFDAVNFRGSTLTDARFERCVLEDADFGAATLRRVSFQGCRLSRADFTQATLDEVDLRGAELDIARGVESLRGATVDSTQLVALAPALASHLGITVRDDETPA
jgi:uncharacterized protein YjbI with pentapeptide repeats